MSLKQTFKNAGTLLSHPAVARDYIAYCAKRALCRPIIRSIAGGVRVGGLTGFSEYHAVNYFLSDAERHFLSTYPFPPGDFLDVGANLGVLTIYLAKRWPDRTVHAFEPNPTSNAALNYNVALNRCDNVAWQPMAVSNYEGSIQFNADPVGRGTARVAVEGDAFATALPCTSLDAYCKQKDISSVGLLKIDVEGLESLVLEGAERLLTSCQVPVVFYEICPSNARRMKISPSQATEILIAHQFAIHRLEADGRLVSASLDDLASTRLANWVAIRR